MLTSYEDFVDAPTDFGNQPISLTQAKQAILEAASNAKKENINPNTTQINSVVDSFNKRLERAKLESAAASKGFATVIDGMITGLNDVQAKYDPNSEANKGKLFTIAELENSNTLGWKNLSNYTLGLKKGTSDVLGAGAASVVHSLSSDRMEMIDGTAIAVDQKREKFKQLENQYFNAAISLQKQVDSGAMLDTEMQAVLAIKRQEVDAHALTAEEEAILNKVPDSRLNLDSDVTNQQLLDIAADQRKAANRIPATIDDFLAGSRHYNAHESKELSAKIDAEIAPDVEILNQAKDAFKDGNYGEAAMEGLPALARVIYKGLYEGVKDPKAALQSISEEFSSIAVARMGVLGMAVNAAESFGVATKIQADGIESFIKEHGRKPTPEEFNEIAAWSYTAGAMDMASDVVVSGAGKGFGKALKGAPKESIEAIRAKAINQTVEEAAAAATALAGPSVMGRAAKAAVKTAVGFAENAGMEGITEGAQQIIEDFSSKLKDVGDLKDAANATAMGALVGGGMGPTSKAVEVGTKITAGATVLAGAGVVGAGKLVTDGLSATKERIEEQAVPKSKEQVATESMYKGRAAYGYAEAKAATVESGDITAHIDPENKDTYRPILAVDALAEINAKPETSYEDKAKNLEQALGIQEEFTFQSGIRQLELRDLKVKKDAGTLTVAERKRYRELETNIKKDDAYRTDITAKIQSMSQTELTAQGLKDALTAAQTEEDPEQAVSALRQIFGSASGGMDIDSLGSALKTLKANKNLTPEVQEAIAHIEAFNESKDRLRTQQSKTTDEVQSDVLNGMGKYKGVAQYNRNISTALSDGNEAFAVRELGQLSIFAQTQQRKATTLRNVSNGTASPEEQAHFEEMSQERVRKGQRPLQATTHAGWERFVSNTEHEADVLQKAVAQAKGLFVLHGKTSPAVSVTPVVKSAPKATPSTPKVPEVKQKAKASSTADVKQSTAQPTADTVAPTPEVKDAPPVREQPPHPADTKAELKKEVENFKTKPEVKAPAEPVIVNETPVGETQKDLSSTSETQAEVKSPPKVTESSGKVEQAEQQEKEVLNEEETPLFKAEPITNEQDYRSLNIIGAFFSRKSLEDMRRMLGTGDFFKALRQQVGSNKKADLLLGSMEKFSVKLGDSVKATFKFRVETDFRYKDPVQYLATEAGVLPVHVLNAISTASYKWLATRGKETLFNDTRTIQKMLGVQKDINIEAARNLLKEIGVQQDVLADTLGQEVYRLLGLKSSKQVPADFEARLVKALGLQAIAAMEHQGTLKMTPVFTGKSSTGYKSDGTYGMDALKSNVVNRFNNDVTKYVLSDKDDSFYAPSEIDRAGRMVSKYYRVETTTDRDENDFLQESKELQKFIALWDDSKQTYEDLLSADDQMTEYSWTPFDKGHRAKIKKTNQYTTVEQADNVIENSNQGNILSISTATPFLALDRQSQLDISGFEDPKEFHADDRDGVIDTNKSLMRNLDAVHSWITDAMNQPNGLRSKFYIPVEFYRNTRMGQRGSINPQNSKIHRYLFGMPEWAAKVTISNNKKGVLTKSEQRFFEALGLGLGVESSKKGGLKKAIATTQEKLQNEDVMAAVRLLQDHTTEIHTPGFAWTPDQAKILVAGVKAGGEKVKTFKALVEYARYLNAKESKEKHFTTDIATEIDGMSNGPILMKMQFLFKITRANLAMLRNGGLTFTTSKKDTGEHLDTKAQLDTYEAGGMAWSEALEKHIATLVQEYKTLTANKHPKAGAIKRELQRIVAAKQLLGEFNDDQGFVKKLVRKLTKSPVMTTGYGAGEESLKQELTRTLVEDTIRGRLKSISQMPVDTQEQRDELYLNLRRLTYRINLVADLDPKKSKPTDQFQIPDSVNALILKDGKLDKEQILSMRIPQVSLKAIHAQIQTGHGGALATGINAIYGDIQDARTSLNLGFTIATTLYNTAREIAVKKRKAELQLPVVLVESIADKKNGKSKSVETRTDLSVEEYVKIDAELAKLFPTLNTTFGGKMDMAKQSRDKQYSAEDGKKIEQHYNKKSTKVSVKRDYLSDPTVLQMPGVSPMVMSVIMMDATIANKTQGQGLSILNCHDGFYAGIGNVEAVNATLNRNMYEMMRDFDLAQTMHDSVDASILAFQAFRTQQGGYADAKQKTEWDKALNEAFRANNITQSKFGKKVFDDDYQKAIDDTLNEMQESATIATQNKVELLSYLENLNQYYYPGKGLDITDQAPVVNPTMTSEDLANMDALTEEENKERAAQLLETRAASDELLTEIIPKYLESMRDARSSSTTPVSTNELDYDPVMQIDQQNAVDTFDQIHNAGTVQATDAHNTQLRRILFEIVSKVMNPADLFLKTDVNSETAGAVEVDGANTKIFISSQAQGPAPVSGILAQGIRMSTGEVFVHELVHAVTQTGLKSNARLRRHVAVLYELAQAKMNANGEGFRVFLNDPTININDPAYVFEVQAAKDRWEYLFGTKIQVTPVSRYDSATGLTQTKEYSHHLDEFMAFGLTNDNFIQALSSIQIDNYKGKIFKSESWKGIKGRNIQETMGNVLNKITDMIMHNFAHRKPERNMARELESLAQRLSAIDSNNKTMAATILAQVDKHQQKMAEFVNGQIKKVFSGVDRKLRISRKAAAVSHAMHNQNSAFGQMLRDYRSKIDGFNYGILQATATSIKGLTNRVEDLHRLLNTRRLVIDQARESATMRVKNALSNLWSRPLSKHEKAAILKAAIKTDVAALREHFDMAGIQALVDPSAAIQGQQTALAAAIAQVHRQMDAHLVLKPYRHYFQKQARSLGHTMAHNRALEKVSLMNATLIGGLYNTDFEGKLTGTDLDEAIDLVDQLATMYALEFTPAEHRTTLRDLMTEDMDAVENTIIAHAELMRDAKENLFNNNPLKIMKGYTKDITNPRIKITSAPISEEATLLTKGFTRSPQPLARDEHDPDQSIPMYLYISRVGAVNDLQSGISSATGNHAMGTNLIQNAAKQGQDPLLGVMNNAALLVKKRRDLNAMFNGPMRPYNQGDKLPSYMIPQVDDTGKITKYRYMLTETVKDGLLEKHNAFDDVLGAMAGTVPDKLNTNVINARLIQALKDLYDKEYTVRHTMYVEISPFAANERHRAIYHMLPDKAKADMQQVWGEQRMFVAKDVVDLAFGSRKYTMLEAFAKDPQARNFVERMLVDYAQQFFKDKTITRVKQVEDVLQSMVKIAKNNMIVKSFTTSFNNHVSNLFYCKAKGVSYSNILKWKREATIGVIQYQSDKKKLDGLEMQLIMSQGRKPSTVLTQATINATNARLEGKIRELKNELALNPVNDLMQAGLMQSIVDDVETGGVQSPFPDTIEIATNKLMDKLPERVVNLGKVVLLAEDTQGYKVLNNAVKMIDFIGRYIMYKHYMQDVPPVTSVTSRANFNNAHKKAVAKVIYEFVNFNLPDHRMVDYANSIGFAWYTRYALRVLRPFAEMIKDKPFEAITAFALAHTLGMANVAASTLFLGKNPLDLLGNPLSAFLSSSDDAITLQATEAVIDTIRN